MRTAEWLTLIIAGLTLVAGPGWVKYFLERRNEKRAAAKAVLEGFLLPLKAILEQNHRVHAALTHDQEFRNLEHAPDYLQQHFASLPDTDSRKLAWKTLIEGLLRDNQRAVELIQQNMGRIIRDDFRQACKDFVYHANCWDAMWRAAIGDQPVPDSLHGADKLLTPAFPQSMDSELKREIEEWRGQVGA